MLLIQLRRILSFLGLDLTAPTVVYSDSQAAIAALRKPKLSTKMKHVDIRFHKLRECLTPNLDDPLSHPGPEMTLAYEPTTTQPADVLTKQLPPPSFEWHRDRMLGAGLVPHALSPSTPPSGDADVFPAPVPSLHSPLTVEEVCQREETES